MSGEQLLNKTNRINLLIDFYGSLLTDKQRTSLGYYFHEDYSLSEIAEALDISRQAVYEHIKRSEQMLEDYESKLGLLARHEQRLAYSEQVEALLAQYDDREHDALKQLVRKLYPID